MSDNPLGIHCIDCTVAAPCEACAAQIARELKAFNEAPSSLDWADRCDQLAESMVGFKGFTLWMQGLLIGHSLASGEIWDTPNMATSLVIMQNVYDEATSMTEAWGFEQ